MILFVENKKDPAIFGLSGDNYRQARNYDEAVSLWETKKFDEIYLDYDLDGKYNGIDFLEYAVTIKKPSKVKIISINIVGIYHISLFCKENNISL